MMRRWVIRSVFLLPLFLGVIGCGWSYARSQSVFVYWAGGGRKAWVLEADYSGCYSLWQTAPDPPPNLQYDALVGWFWGLQGGKAPFSARTYLGFHVSKETDPELMRTRWQVALPSWFLLAIFAGLLAYMWRKTRPTINPATAFPVEIKAKKVTA